MTPDMWHDKRQQILIQFIQIKYCDLSIWPILNEPAFSLIVTVYLRQWCHLAFQHRVPERLPTCVARATLTVEHLANDLRKQGAKIAKQVQITCMIKHGKECLKPWHICCRTVAEHLQKVTADWRSTCCERAMLTIATASA